MVKLLDYETVASELGGDPDIREATLSLLRKGLIEATRLEDGQIAFRAVDAPEALKKGELEMEIEDCGMCGLPDERPLGYPFMLDDRHAISVCDACFTDLDEAGKRVGHEVVNAAIKAYLAERGIELVVGWAPAREALSGLKSALLKAGVLPAVRTWKQTFHERLVGSAIEKLEEGGHEVKRLDKVVH
jgi:hypothetical protein